MYFPSKTFFSNDIDLFANPFDCGHNLATQIRSYKSQLYVKSNFFPVVVWTFNSYFRVAIKYSPTENRQILTVRVVMISVIIRAEL